jgi:hypothetical protein
MFELVVGVLLGWGMHAFFTRREKEPKSSKRYYFDEDTLPRSDQYGQYGDITFFTIAEFNETRTVGSGGLEKELGFSDYPVLFDREAKRIKAARVTFIGADGYDRGPAIGYFRPLDARGHHLELTVLFSLSEYDSVFENMKQAAERRAATGERTYFLYEMKTSVRKSHREQILYEIHSFNLAHTYYNEDILLGGLNVMIEVERGANDNDSNYQALCRDYLNRFLRLIGAND